MKNSQAFTRRRPLRGTSAVETAVALGLLVVMILAGVWSMSDGMQRLFAQASALERSTGGSTGRAATRTERGGHVAASVDNTAKTTEPVDWRMSVLLSLLVLGSAFQVWLMLRARKHELKKSDEDFPMEEAQLASLHPGLVDKRQRLLRQIANLHLRGTLRAATVRDVMSDTLYTVHQNTPLTEAVELMRKHRVRHMLVCDQDKHLQGIISDRDLGRRAATYAKQIMSSKPVTAAPDMELIPAVTMMMNRGISALPVVNADKLVGILTTTDLMLIMQCMILLDHRTACEEEEAQRATVPMGEALTVGLVLPLTTA